MGGNKPGSIFCRNDTCREWAEEAFNWLDCIYTLDTNAHNPHRGKKNKPATRYSHGF
jgi:hypothetical protein